MFREVMNRRRMLLTLTGIGGMALMWQVINHRSALKRSAADKTSGFRTAPVVELEVTCADNQLVFSPTKLVVRANAEIHLSFYNVSTIFMHNWVLAKREEGAVDQVIQAGAGAGPTHNYLPEDMRNVIAYTELVDHGESAQITFMAPPVGEYTYLCTFPGHYLAGMRGTLIISAQRVVTEEVTTQGGVKNKYVV